MSESKPASEPVGSVRTETIIHQGHPVSIVRDRPGNIIYPSYVPPQTKAPVSSKAALSQEPDHDKPADADPRDHEQPAESNAPENQAKSRPSTEIPKPTLSGMHTYCPPPAMLRRAGTSASGMERALAGDEHSSSSSSEPSSSEDEDTQKRKARPKKKTKHKKGRNHDGDDDDHYGRFSIKHPHYRTKGHVSKRDGRLTISLHDTSNTGYLAKALGQAAARKMARLKQPLRLDDDNSNNNKKRPSSPPLSPRFSTASTALPPPAPIPRLNIVIMVIGSRGDAQPFLKIAQLLANEYGHRVRIATHPAFRSFIEQDLPRSSSSSSSCGEHRHHHHHHHHHRRRRRRGGGSVEFFSIGGDPSELMAFMVKNPGMIPTLSSVRAGDVGRRRAAMAAMFEGFWRACINATDDERDPANLRLMGGRDPFVADLIIANPPCFAHVHCAEALGVPLHLVFTFPYTPTQAFPHPLATVKRSNVDPGYTNFISYPLVEMMVWQGLGDLVNDFRVGTLGLDPVSTLWAPGATYRLHVPFTYLWSPALVPKPPDWGPEIDVAGFVFLDLASSFEPPEALTRFLEEAGDEPLVYIGFGSIVVDDADRFTDMIFEAVRLAGVRALVSKGWGDLGGDGLDAPPGVFMLGNTPHDWLFPRVRACVIHGGAGTTAIALKCGKPTLVVPFFGDQHFWGHMVADSGAGPRPVPYKRLTAEKLAEGIRYCLSEKARRAAERIARDIAREGDGAENACRSFHERLVLGGERSMRCSILPDRVAAWQMSETGLRLSAVAAELLVRKGMLSWKKLKLLRHNEWNDFEGPGEPVTGIAGSLVSSVGDIFRGVGGVPYRVAKGAKKRRKEKRGREAKEGEGGGWEGAGSADTREGESRQEDLPRVETTTTHAIRGRSKDAAGPTSPVGEAVREVGRGAYQSASALVRTPVDLSVALAQGFHNAPRLYGDDTVRRPTRVTGIRSGLRAARHEFAYGIYDGWTGLVRLPVRGARDDGIRGFVSGVGMGLTGFVLKDIAAIVGPVGYTLKGIAKQAERRRPPTKYIRRARIVQGEREARALSEAERKQCEEEVVGGWTLMRQLWDKMRRAEKRKYQRLFGGFGTTAQMLRRSSEWKAAFENLEAAQKTLEGLNRGDDLEAVLASLSLETATGGSPITEVKSASTDVVHDKDGPTGSVRGVQTTDGEAKPAVETEATTEEGENPFSTDARAITENKAENRDHMAALEIS